MTFHARARALCRRCAATAALALAPHAAAAQGFGLNEIGSCAMARGFATAGAPCDDASVLYWNPAAATMLRGLSVYVGGSAIQLVSRFTADTTRRVDKGDAPIEFPPFVGVAWKGSGALTGRVAVGVAAYVPYGLTSAWRDDFPGRFTAQRASLRTFYVQPTVAVEVVPGRLSVGAGAIYGRSTLELRQGVDLAQQVVPRPDLPAGTRFTAFGIAPSTEFARAELEGDGQAYGAHFGAFLRITPSLTLGARYLTALRFDYEGEARFTPVATGLVLQANNVFGAPGGTPLEALAPIAAQFTTGALTPQGVKTSVEHPAQFQVGLGARLSDRTTLSFDYARVRWTSFDTLRIDFQGPAPDRALIEEYEDTDAFRAGVERRFGGDVLGGWLGGVAGRAGFSYASAAAPDQTVTPLLPDMARYNIAVGAGVPLGRRFTLDAAYVRVETRGRRGRLDERPAGLSAEETVARLNGGFYTLGANVVSLSLKAAF